VLIPPNVSPSTRNLIGLVENDFTFFRVVVCAEDDGLALKKLGFEEGIDTTKRNILAKDLQVWKVCK